MERLSYTNAREEFESLLGRYLFDDLDRYGKRRLFLLLESSPEFAAEFAALADLDDQLFALKSAAHAPAAAAGANAAQDVGYPAHDDAAKVRRLADARRRPAARTLWAAAAGALLIGAVSFYVYSRVFGPGSAAASALVYSGACSAPPANFTAGRAHALQNDSADRFCTIETANGALRFRLTPGGALRIAADSAGVRVHLERGTLFAAGREPGADKNLRIYLGDHSVRFIGTAVRLRVDAAGYKVDVLDGRIRLERSARYLLIPDDPQLEESPALAGLASNEEDALLEERQRELAESQSVYIEEDPERLAQARAALRRLLPTPEEEPDAAELRQRAAALSAADRAALRAPDDAAPAQRLAPETQRELLERLNTDDANAGDGVDSQTPPTDARQTRGTDAPHRVYLRDGRVLSGRAIQENDRLLIRTPEGDVRADLADVLRIEAQ